MVEQDEGQNQTEDDRLRGLGNNEHQNGDLVGDSQDSLALIGEETKGDDDGLSRPEKENEERTTPLEAGETSEDPSDAHKDRFEETFQMARRRDQADTRIFRVWFRIRWLKDGDVPSMFFFACLKAKTRKENITTTKLDTGVFLTEEDQTLKLIEDTYGALNVAEEESTEVTDRRRECLQLVDKTVLGEQNRTLEETPSEEVIQEIVRSLP
ncbi:hypothetical protein R1sor_022430 [Riccia sorocarpa]|uniref:Uncharacterized protein n=1 Tax=Riccia sorocarpa TaxID=122646 RepID=A0ABD3GQP4_9MARC